MKSIILKDTTLGGALGISGFLAVYSIILLIYHVAHITDGDSYPLKYVVPVGAVSVAIWIFCFYRLRKLQAEKGV